MEPADPSPDDLILRPTLRDRLEALAAARKEALFLACAIGLLALVALGIWSRNAPAAIAPPAIAPVEPVTPSATEVLLVHVAGAVQEPGLYGLPAGARIADAIEAAGGAGHKADLDAVNLAEPLSDGLQIVVPRRGKIAAPGAVPGPTATGGVSVVNINTADQAVLETIPGIGPVTATAILEYRSRVGRFESVEELIDVSGIGPATLEAIRPYVTI